MFRRPSWFRQLLRVLALVLSTVVVMALIRALRRDGPAAVAAWRAADVDPPWILFAALAGLAGHLTFVAGWRRLLVDCGVRVSFWQAARFFLVSNLGRYLPAGKAWQMSIVAIMATEQKFPATPVATTSLFHGLLGVGIGALLLIATGGAVIGVPTVWLAAPGGGIAALVALPAILRRMPQIRTTLLQRVPSLEGVSVGTMWALVWTTTLSWFAWGVALYGLALGLMPDSQAPFLSYVAAWIGPFLAGLIAVVAPAGLGVRDELMRTMLTASGLSAGGAIMLVVVARVGTTLLDVVPALAVLALRRGAKPAIPTATQPAASM